MNDIFQSVHISSNNFFSGLCNRVIDLNVLYGIKRSVFFNQVTKECFLLSTSAIQS